MLRLKTVLKRLFWLLVLALAGLAGWLYFAPPEMIRVGANYAAKMVCSNVFLAGRDAGEVLERDVQAPGHPILRLVRVNVDESEGTVRAGLFGLFGKGLAVHRSGTGCATVADGDLAAAQNGVSVADPAVTNGDGLWPDGERVDPPSNQAVVDILERERNEAPGTRAIIVVHDGRIIAETYGDGFSADTPLLGWSMTKTVTAAIIGTLVRDGKLALSDSALFEQWKADGRAPITIADLLAMSSSLKWNEGYGTVSDVTRMLYLEPDMVATGRSQPIEGEPGAGFEYSSGTSVMLSRIWQAALGDPEKAFAYPRRAVFGPLGMTSAVLETDARGTFVGSSYLYATARDWARFGQFLLQDGKWNGRLILPPGYVKMMGEPAAASDGRYGKGHIWLRGPSAGTPEGEHPDAGFDLPKDALWMLGHDGQTVTIIPSSRLVVVRLGLTPSKLGYKPQGMIEALVKAVK